MAATPITCLPTVCKPLREPYLRAIPQNGVRQLQTTPLRHNSTYLRHFGCAVIQAMASVMLPPCRTYLPQHGSTLLQPMFYDSHIYCPYQYTTLSFCRYTLEGATESYLKLGVRIVQQQILTTFFLIFHTSSCNRDLHPNFLVLQTHN